MARKLKLFRIDADLEAGLKRLAAAEHETVSALIRRAIRKYLQETGAISASVVVGSRSNRLAVKKGGKKK